MFRGGCAREPDDRVEKTLGAVRCWRGVDSAWRGLAERLARRSPERDDVPKHRPVSHIRVGDGDRGTRDSRARPPLHHLRGDSHRRSLEDGQQRHHVGPDFGQRRGRRRRRRRRRALQSLDRLDGHRRSGERALVVFGQRRVQVHRRRQDLAAHGTSRQPSHRTHCHPPGQSGNRLRRRDGAPLFEKRGTGRLSGRRTAARRGTRCSTWTMALAQSTS